MANRGFKRPGSIAPAAFGISFDADREDNTNAEASFTPLAHSQNDARTRLPIAKHRLELLFAIETHATTIVVGETGSGKTTQLPQYLLHAGWCDGGKMVACTQPRRVAVMTVAARVAEEVGCALGAAVGYGIRFEDVGTPGVTKLRFCTDGLLLREMMDDPLLTQYSVIMVDEVHERSVATDVLLGLLKKVQKVRKDLRVVISSATMQANVLAAFFDTSGGDAAPPAVGRISLKPCVMSVEGRTHDVQLHYLEAPCSDYVAAAVQAVVDLHTENLPGDVLVFMTGQEDCEHAVKLLEQEATRLRRAALPLRLMPVPLYAGLPAASQLQAFEPPPRGYRKVVVSTNIAETSVTIEGVVYVIDCMFAKQKLYNPLTGLEGLLTAPISKASAVQRAGRAGRIRPGHCFRLCTESEYGSLSDVTVPEMQRCDLAPIVLQLKSLGVDNVMRFAWLAPPPAESMIRALELLHALGGLDDDARLTPGVGKVMAELSLAPQMARAVLASLKFGATEEVLTVAAMLSVQSVWRGSRAARKAFDEARAKFAVAEGDLITYLNVWRAWEASGRSGKWAAGHFLNHRTLLRAADIRSQLHKQLRRLLKLDMLPQAAGNMEAVRKALTAGLFFNAAQLTEALDVNLVRNDGTAVYKLIRSTSQPVRLRMHQSSVLWRVRSACVVFVTAVQGDSDWYEMQEVLAVDPHWLAELAPHVYAHTHTKPRTGDLAAH